LSSAFDSLLARQTVKIREFLSQTAHVHRQSRYNELLDSMSLRLKADVALCWAKETLLRVNMFKNRDVFEDEFLASAALALLTRIFCRTEYIPVVSLLIIERGVAAKDGHISGKGACLGEDMVLESQTFRDLTPAIAITFVVQVSCLEKKALVALLERYPLARREIRSSSFRLAFIRATMQLATVVRMQREMGKDTTIVEAFEIIRKTKARAVLAHARIAEPTRKALVSTMQDLSDRTEYIAKEGKQSRTDLSNQVEALNAKMDMVLRALGAAAGTPSPQLTSQSWLQAFVPAGAKAEAQHPDHLAA
jgi:hypothetical protein